MKVRRLEQAEHGLTRPLYEEVFSEDSKRFIDYYYTEKTKDNQIYVAEEDGGIQAMLHLNPYELNVNGTKKKANYIVAVATRESYRGRGFMKVLLETALKDMYREGESFTYLMPAAEAIYTPHGFRTVRILPDRRSGGCDTGKWNYLSGASGGKSGYSDACECGKCSVGSRRLSGIYAEKRNVLRAADERICQ